jgi:hypothetical protein
MKQQNGCGRCRNKKSATIFCIFNDMQQKPDISAKAFWDTKFEHLDYQQHKDYIIAKVFEFGKWEDMIEVTRFYGEKEVKKALVKYPFFFPDTISFISIIFNTPKEQLACYKNNPYRQNAFS